MHAQLHFVGMWCDHRLAGKAKPDEATTRNGIKKSQSLDMSPVCAVPYGFSRFFCRHTADLFVRLYIRTCTVTHTRLKLPAA
jgi:hypothetical protein